MKIRREFIQYRYEHQSFAHHLLMVEHGQKKVLLSAVNIYLQQHASASEKTSQSYSTTIKRFIEFLIENTSANELTPDLWRKATPADLRNWQGKLVSVRDDVGLSKPSDKTIRHNAHIVHQFYTWASDNGFPVIFNGKTKEWTFNFKNESKLINKKSMISGLLADHANIDLKGASTHRSEKKHIHIMGNEDISLLMNSYKDPVYPAILMMALATGMREEGCSQFPYIGTGENSHIRPYPDILNEIKNGHEAKTFSFTVIEKGNKIRTLQVNMAAWKVICGDYLSHFYERKKKLEARHPNANSSLRFFLKKNGEPVTPKDISDQTFHAKKRIGKFPWTFHNTRDWYATNFIIKHLSKSEVDNLHYNAAVEEQLRKQLGHSDIKTTYMHYVRQASLVLALRDGSIDYTLGKTETFFESLTKK